MEKILQFILSLIGSLVMATVLALLGSLPVMLIWNLLMPELFGFKVITWMQALGLCMLCAALFKSGK